MAKRIGILTGGGDCPGLNAVIRAVVKHARGTHGWAVVGIEDGFQGVYEERYRPLGIPDVRDLLTRGGTILGSSNRANPFAYPIVHADGTVEARDVSAKCLANLDALDLDGLICVGGEGTMGMSQQLFERGVEVVGVPKTIDNDLGATDFTFGFQTAVEVCTEALDRLHTTAESHDRIIICEVMGRYAGWIALHAGVAAGADVILIPEIPYDLERVIKCFRRRKALGITYSIVVVSEGAMPKGGSVSVVRSGDPTQQEKLGGAGQRLADQLVDNCPFDVRVTVLGHIQRGGTPSAFDRTLATRYGVAAVDLIAAGKFGHMVALRGREIVSVPIAEAVRMLKIVSPTEGLVAAARATGVELGG